MGLSACGCETRAAPSNSLATTALFTSWNNANALNVFSALSTTLNSQILAPCGSASLIQAVSALASTFKIQLSLTLRHGEGISKTSETIALFREMKCAVMVKLFERRSREFFTIGA